MPLSRELAGRLVDIANDTEMQGRFSEGASFIPWRDGPSSTWSRKLPKKWPEYAELERLGLIRVGKWQSVGHRHALNGGPGDKGYYIYDYRRLYTLTARGKAVAESIKRGYDDKNFLDTFLRYYRVG